jgi:hypothetical protein
MSPTLLMAALKKGFPSAMLAQIFAQPRRDIRAKQVASSPD